MKRPAPFIVRRYNKDGLVFRTQGFASRRDSLNQYLCLSELLKKNDLPNTTDLTLDEIPVTYRTTYRYSVDQRDD